MVFSGVLKRVLVAVYIMLAVSRREEEESVACNSIQSVKCFKMMKKKKTLVLHMCVSSCLNVIGRKHARLATALNRTCHPAVVN